MVDSNLIILGALAAGGYYAMFVYEWPSVEDITKEVVDGLIDTGMAAGSALLEKGGDALYEVGETLVDEATPVVTTVTTGIADTWRAVFNPPKTTKSNCSKKNTYCLVGSTCNQCCHSWQWWASGAYCCAPHECE